MGRSLHPMLFAKIVLTVCFLTLIGCFVKILRQRREDSTRGTWSKW